MYNTEIRDAIRARGFFHYEVANQMGMSAQAFSHLMARCELTGAAADRIYSALNMLEQKRDANKDTISYQTLDDIIAEYVKYAEDRLDDACLNSPEHDQLYWANYRDGVNGVRWFINKRIRKEN